MMNIPRKSYRQGQVMLVAVVFFLILSMTIVFGVATPIMKAANVSQENLYSKQSYYAAESAIEDIYIRLQKNTVVGTSETLALNGGSVTITTIPTIGGKQTTVEANVKNDVRKIQVQLIRGDGVVFKYGTQSGQGGFQIDNNAILNGSLYSNGNIMGSNGAQITGDAVVAGSSGTLNNVAIGGSALAHTITNSVVTGTVYCQTGSGNNKACNTSQADPPVLDLPITADQLAEWKADATAGGTVTGDTTINTSSSIGPKKFAGNLTISGTATLNNTIWVTGNILITGRVNLANSYGASSGVIIADGYIDINNGVIFNDSGTAGSYILFLSTSNCDASNGSAPCNGHDAITVGNNSNITIMNAQNGTVYFANNSSVKESVGNKIHLKNNSTISYGTGVINPVFTSGPSGGYNLTYVSEIQ